MKTRLTFQIVLLLAALAAAPGQEPSTALQTTAAGRRVQEYLKAFNSGSDSTMRGFFARNLDAEAGRRIPIDQRIERYHQMRSMAGTFTLKRVLRSSDDRASVIVSSRDGYLLKMDFQCETAAPHGLVAVAVEEVQPGDEAVTPAKDDAALADAAGRYVRSQADSDRFSGVVLIAKGGTPIFREAYGLADREKNIPNTIDTRFNLGSMNKIFTHLAIDQLASAGKISLADTLGTILPGYPNHDAARKITMRQLLDMSSGIGDFFNERYDAAPKESLRTIGAYMTLFADKPLSFEPGSRRMYSNGGYIVLGAIVEKVSGLDYYTYVRRNIFVPAGMNATDSFAKDSLPADAAIGYTMRGGGGSMKGWRPNYDRLPGRGSSAGGGYSTAMDLLRYTMALAGAPFVPSSFEPKKGLGIAGGMEGVNAALEWNPATGYAIIVLCNMDPPAAEKTAQHIRALLPR